MILTKAYGKIGRLQKRIKIIQGGQGASKTYSILQLILLRAIYEPLRATIVTETYPQLKDGVIADMKAICEDVGIDFETQYNKSDKNLHVFDSVIQFRNIDNKDFRRSQGVRRDILFINEANRTHWASVEQMITRSKEVFIDFNPDREFWVHEQIIKQDSNKGQFDFIVLTYKDNSELSDEERNEIERRVAASKLPVASTQLKNWVRIYATGELGTYSDRRIYDYQLTDTIPEKAKRINSGMDFAISPDATVLINVWKDGIDLYVDELFSENNLLPEKITGAERMAIVDKMDDISFEKGWPIVADSSGRVSILDMRKHGYNVIAVKKYPGSVLDGIKKLRAYNLHFTARSKTMRKGVETWFWKVDENGKVIPEPDGHEPDPLAALRYVIMTNLEY